MQLTTNVSQLNRVGKVLAKRLQHLGVETVEDLLFYFPFRYEDYSQVGTIGSLKDGEQMSIKASVEVIATKRSPRKGKLITEAVVADNTGRMRIVWFGQPFISKLLKVGDEVYFSGKVTRDILGPQMVGPGYEKVKNWSEHKNDTIHTARIVPIYSLTTGITQKQIRFLLSQIIGLTREVAEWLPEKILEKADLAPIAEAIRGIHFPNDEIDLKQAERRLKFDELFILQLRAEMIRQSLKRSQAFVVPLQTEAVKDFVSRLPFKLTDDQRIAAWEILKDIERIQPMNRLLEGDVGSGKTVVATLVMYDTALNGYQAVFMAPTEILAKQHFTTVAGWLAPFGVKVVLLTRSEAELNYKSIFGLSSSQGEITNHKSFNETKNSLVEIIQTRDAQVIIGTHALLGENVKFKKLGLVIVDEQHRFGVEQRKTIREKSGNKDKIPHFLSMTATPIPRSFALTLYGDLDLSIIKQMPAGRKTIITRAVAPHNREKAYEFVLDQVKSGRQVFVVCPLISAEKGEKLGNNIDDRKSVLAEYEKLRTMIFPDLKIAYLHGRMKVKEKTGIMKKFNAAEIDILVATSVVEVGVDIPNASVMMIEGAERFGLAQLHQFRGRVGRSSHQSYCFLFTDSDSQKVAERLAYFEKTADGFALAEYDLQTRGPGEVYGTAQSGLMNFRLATMKDVEIIKLARSMAKGIDFEKYAKLKEKVKEWEQRVHLE